MMKPDETTRKMYQRLYDAVVDENGDPIVRFARVIDCAAQLLDVTDVDDPICGLLRNHIHDYCLILASDVKSPPHCPNYIRHLDHPCPYDDIISTLEETMNDWED